MNEINKPERDNDVSAKVTSPEQLRQQEQAVRDAGAEINNLSLDKDFEVSKPKDTKAEGDNNSKRHFDENDLAIEKLGSNNEPIEDVAKEERLETYKDISEFNNELNKLYADKNISNQEKVDAAKEYVDKLNHSDLSTEDKKQSVDVPSDARALKNPENSDWTQRTDDNPWPPLNIDFPGKMGLDYSKEITPLGRGSENAKLPENGYRYGGEGGYNYTCEKDDGHIPTLEERSVPKVYIPEKDRNVHFDNDNYFDAIDAIKNYDADPAESLISINSTIDKINAQNNADIKPLDADELEYLSDRYKQLQETEFAAVRAELGISDQDFTAYGVHGYARPMEDKNGETICEGGADQFNTALPEYMLKKIGVEW